MLYVAPNPFLLNKISSNQVKWSVSLVIADGYFNLSQGFMWMYVWVRIRGILNSQMVSLPLQSVMADICAVMGTLVDQDALWGKNEKKRGQLFICSFLVIIAS